jgi:hypothetical protein
MIRSAEAVAAADIFGEVVKALGDVFTFEAELGKRGTAGGLPTG